MLAFSQVLHNNPGISTTVIIRYFPKKDGAKWLVTPQKNNWGSADINSHMSPPPNVFKLESKLKISEEDLSPRMRQRSNTLPKSFGSQLEKEDEKKQELVDKAVKPSVEATLESIQRKLQEKRAESSRPEDIKVWGFGGGPKPTASQYGGNTGPDTWVPVGRGTRQRLLRPPTPWSPTRLDV